MMTIWVFSLLFVGLAMGIRDTTKNPHNEPLLRREFQIFAEQGDIIGNVTENINNFLTFLCTRCQQIITQIDESISNQSLIKYAVDFCDKAIGNPSLREFCGGIVKDVLSQVYKQLNKFEPHPDLCTHLRLCDACLNGSTPHRRALPLLRASTEQPAFLNPFSIYTRIAPLAEIFEQDARLKRVHDKQ